MPATRLISRLREHGAGLVRPEDVVAVSAQPPPLRRVSLDHEGHEQADQKGKEPQPIGCNIGAYRWVDKLLPCLTPGKT